MPAGDIGGSSSCLIITCIADCDIMKGDPICFIEDYIVNTGPGELFGQALSDCDKGYRFPVRIKGICSFKHSREWLKENSVKVLKEKELGPGPKGRNKILYANNGRLDVLL